MSTATKLTLGGIEAESIRRIVVVRSSRAARTLVKRGDIDHFIREHMDDELQYKGDDRLVNAKPGLDYFSITVELKAK